MNKIINISLLVLLILSCNQEVDPPKIEEEPSNNEGEVPTLQGLEMVQVTNSSAIFDSKVENDGGYAVLERGVCFMEGDGVPTLENHYIEASSVKGSGEFSASLNALNDGIKYSARAYAVNEIGVGYGEKLKFETPAADKPEVETGVKYISAAHSIHLRVALNNDGGFPITEKGVCWDLEPSPSIDEEVIEMGNGMNSFLAEIKGLDPEKKYYLRAYAKNEKGVSYGNTLEVTTRKKGNITFTLHEDPNPSTELQENYDRIKEAFKKAVEYYNSYTSIEKHINVYYNPGVPTADGNINGTIRIGSNVSYQRTGTAMHEIAHVVGVGTHWKWGELIQGGTYVGPRANEIIQILSGDNNSILRGDGTHFWPYGINGAHEDSGSPELYIWHALIMQGMKDDGLPSF
ncbi:hypothetical protein QWY93_04015 [Echinicola jeungdonensis]|uniref:Fibronectin type-III domain-containing protein n=1 Tax=Echinicola jeungdonensis TaxID=709343 RepID=A0ABV5J1G1_9BACT|nr:hypothetical protein [Echinicola jeungdonensis]MDN3668492.1 hypothetical protein [Echinicola jeungdonensis]